MPCGALLPAVHIHIHRHCPHLAYAVAWLLWLLTQAHIHNVSACLLSCTTPIPLCVLQHEPSAASAGGHCVLDMTLFGAGSPFASSATIGTTTAMQQQQQAAGLSIKRPAPSHAAGATAAAPAAAAAAGVSITSSLSAPLDVSPRAYSPNKDQGSMSPWAGQQAGGRQAIIRPTAVAAAGGGGAGGVVRVGGSSSKKAAACGGASRNEAKQVGVLSVTTVLEMPSASLHLQHALVCFLVVASHALSRDDLWRRRIHSLGEPEFPTAWGCGRQPSNKSCQAACRFHRFAAACSQA